LADGADDALLSGVRFGVEGGALEHLAEVVRIGLGVAGTYGGRREDGGVRAAAADDDLGAAVQELYVRVHAGYGHHPVCGVELLGGEVAAPVEAGDPLALAHALPEVVE